MRQAFLKFRESLNENKVFFEIIVAGLLSWMAITVSMQANQIADTQTKIMEQENLPQLEIRMKQEKNSSTGIYDNNIWLIFNRGGKISDFEMKDFSFVEYVTKKDLKFDTLSIPLYGYLSMTGTLSGEGDGLIYEFDNDHHGGHENKLRQALLNHGIFEVHSFCKISYTDIFDKSHNEYYRLAPKIERVSDSEWDHLDSLNRFGPHKIFMELKPDYFLNIRK